MYLCRGIGDGDVKHAASGSIPVELPALRPAGVVSPELITAIDRNRGTRAILLLPLNLAHFLGLRAGGHHCHDLRVHPRRCRHWLLLEDSHLTTVRGKCIKQEFCARVCVCLCVCVCAHVHYLFLNLTVFRAVGKPRRVFSGSPAAERIEVCEVQQQLGVGEKVVKEHLVVLPLQATGEFFDNPAAKTRLNALLLPGVHLKLGEVPVPILSASTPTHEINN